MKIDINVDMGESYGRYVLGDDEALMPYVTSANIATCFHAGDPAVLEQTVKWAKQYGVAPGAHVGLGDLRGFGRRRIDVSPVELRTDVIYQLGAIEGFLKVHGLTLQHIKPHGILYRMVGEDEQYIDTFLDAVADYDPELVIMLHQGCEALTRAEARGLKTAHEILVDLGYDAQGNWLIERVKKARAPEEVAARAVRAVTEGVIDTIDGGTVPVQGVTVCIHGDGPNAPAVAKAVHEALTAAGITPANLTEIAQG
jgi:UPF0271 protein